MIRTKLLRRAREIVADPKNWTIGVLARDAEGDAIECFDPGAVSFCMMGGLWKAAYELMAVCEVGEIAGDRFGLTSLISQVTWPHGIIATNDILGHAAILDAFDRAIVISEKEDGDG